MLFERPTDESTGSALSAADSAGSSPSGARQELCRRGPIAGRRSPASGVAYNRAALKSSRYAEAGVDIDAKAAALARAKAAIRSTFTPGVLGDVGGFGGLFLPDFSKYKEPVLVASTDGVGTKLKVAIEMGRHDTVRRGPRQPLRQRHPRPGRETALLPRLHRHREVEPGVIESVIAGDGARLPRERHGAARRRDGGDAGLLRRRRIRRRGHDRGRGGPREDRRRHAHRRRRRRRSGCRPSACRPTATRWRGGCSSRRWARAEDTPRRARRRADRRRAARRAPLVPRRWRRCSRPASSTAWRT